MIPNAETVATHTGTLVSDPTRFSLDQDSLAHLMGLLSDLYSDLELAVLREYATNGLDATIAAEKTTPIEITLPSSLDPTLIIQDYGIGLTAEEIEQFYGRYGFSTKRQTNEQAGMLGIGCKVGLAYADQMTLEAVKDEVKSLVLITKDADGVGTLQVIGEQPAPGESNGVKISIPVTDIRAMRRASESLFYYWAPGTVLVDGVQPPNVWEQADLVQIDEDIIMVPGTYNGRIVMGNVPYPAETVNVGNFSIVARVPLGSVNFTPSREALQTSDLTNETLKELRTYVEDTYIRKIQEKIDTYTDPIDAVRLSSQMSGVRRSSGYGRPAAAFTYRGTPIPHYVPTNGYVWSQGYGARAEKLHGSTTLSALADAALIVVGSPRIGSNMKLKAEKWLTDNGVTGSRKVYFVEKNPAPAWLSGNIVSADDIRAVKIPTPARTSSRKSGVRLIDQDGDLLYVPEMPDGRLVFTTSELPTWDRPALGRLASVLDDVDVVSVRKGGEAKFQRDNPDALTIDEFLDLAAKEVMADINLEALYVERTRYNENPRLTPDLDKLTDQRLVRYLTIYNKHYGTRSTAGHYNILVTAFNTFGKQGLPPIDLSEYNSLASYVRAQYPFLFTYAVDGVVDATWLCNAWKRDNSIDSTDDTDPNEGDSK